MTTDLDIIIPVRFGNEAALERCLAAIAANTAVRAYRAIVAFTGDPGYPPRKYDFAGHGVPWVAIHISEGSMRTSVVGAIEYHCEGSYIAVIPPTHAITDPQWFPKMQQPFLVTPQCGLTIACDDQKLAGTGMQPFPWTPHNGTPGQLALAPRGSMRAIAKAATQRGDDDYAEELIRAAKSLGLVSWAIPTVRIDIAGAAAESAGKEPPDARSAR